MWNVMDEWLYSCWLLGRNRQWLHEETNCGNFPFLGLSFPLLLTWCPTTATDPVTLFTPRWQWTQHKSAFGRSDWEEYQFKARCVTISVIYCCEMEYKYLCLSHKVTKTFFYSLILSHIKECGYAQGFVLLEEGREIKWDVGLYQRLLYTFSLWDVAEHCMHSGVARMVKEGVKILLEDRPFFLSTTCV